MAELDKVLKAATNAGASDLHLAPGEPFIIRKLGKLRKIQTPSLPPEICEKLIYELLDFVDDVVDNLGSREAISLVPRLLESGTGADRQLAVYEETGSLVSVVDFVCGQFLA